MPVSDPNGDFSRFPAMWLGYLYQCVNKFSTLQLESGRSPCQPLLPDRKHSELLHLGCWGCGDEEPAPSVVPLRAAPTAPGFQPREPSQRQGDGSSPARCSSDSALEAADGLCIPKPGPWAGMNSSGSSPAAPAGKAGTLPGLFPAIFQLE